MTLNPQALAAQNTVTDLEALADHYRRSVEQFESNIASVQEAIDLKSDDLPITHEQRKVMFPAFENVFGTTAKPARKAFTRIVLGKGADEPVSWADQGDRNGQGALTRGEASKVIDALKALEDALDQSAR